MNRATWINLTVCLLVVGASAPPSFGQRRRRKVPVQPVKVQHFSGEIKIEGEFRDEERTSSTVTMETITKSTQAIAVA